MTTSSFDATPARLTVFDTPVIRTILRWFSIAFLRVVRWRTRAELPGTRRWLLIIAPHTSYWDGVLLLAAALKHEVKAHWLGKHTFFRGPGRILLRWLGGIPVNPAGSGEGRVDQVVAVFESSDDLRLAIAPEAGFRKVATWRSGFYHIAVEAGVPLVLGFIDYGTRTVGAGDHFLPSGDPETDYARIRGFYAPMTPRHPDRFALPEPPSP